MKKTLIATGVVATLLGVGYLVLRKKKSVANFGGYTFDVPTYLTRAAKQIALATGGSRLTDYRKADDSALMMGASAYNAEAHAKAAYWLAVASRLTGKSSLAAAAYGHNTKAGLIYGIPGSSFLTGDVESITKDALLVLPNDRRLVNIRAILGEHAKPAVIAARQKDESEQNVLWNTTTASANDVATGLQYTKGLVTGEKPPGYGAIAWWFHKWGWRLGAGAVLLLGLRFAFKDEYNAAKGLITGGASKVKGLLGTSKVEPASGS